jgi:hypothetical protein
VFGTHASASVERLAASRTNDMSLRMDVSFGRNARGARALVARSRRSCRSRLLPVRSMGRTNFGVR